MDIFSTIFISILSPLVFILIFISAFFLKIYSSKSSGDPSYPPVEGTIFLQLLHFKTLFDYQTEVAKKHPTFRFLAPYQSEYYTTDPENVEHILKTNFGNYDKGNYSIDRFRDLFGRGIFAVDGDKWKQQRKLASFEFSTKVLREFSCAVFRRKVVKLVGITAELSKTNQAFDIHMVKEDILSRFLVVSKEEPEEMNDEYLRDIILNFMIAGKDTTGNALSWFIFILCKNPIVQEKIAQEVRHDLFGGALDSEGLVADVNKFVELITDEKLLRYI